MNETAVTTQTNKFIFWLMQGISLLGFLAAAAFLILWILQPATDNWIASLLLLLFGLTPWLVIGTYVEMDSQRILLHTIYGKFKINWNEVKYLETDGRIYAFTGENKRVAIIMSSDTAKMKQLSQFAAQQLKMHQIEI